MDQARPTLPPHASASRRSPLDRIYVLVLGLRGRGALATAGLLGFIANLAFPPIYIWPAMMLALCGLIWLLDGARLTTQPAKAAFWRIFAFGFVYFLSGLHWIAAAFAVDASAHMAMIWMPLVLLPAGLALILAGFMSIAFKFWSEGPARLIIFSTLFVFAEWVRGALFGIGGLPWNLPGMIWAPGGSVSQSASIFGIYGLSLLTVAALSAPAILVDSRPRGTSASRAAPILVAAVIFGTLWGWGARRLDTAPQGDVGQMVRLIEAGVPQGDKYKPGVAERLLQRYRALTGPDDPESPSIVIWPEGALPYFLFEWPEALDSVTERIGDRRLILGVGRRELVGDTEEVAYNSLAVLTGSSDLRGPLSLYDKNRLVPFGEFMPGGTFLKAIGLETLQNLAPGGWEAGPPPATISVAGMPPFGPLICYEAIFPGLSPTGVDRPRWLVNISNDSWFGKFLGPYQHSAQARYRSIEEGLPMARVAAGGQTGMIDAYGRWTARAEPANPDIYGPDPEGWRSHIVDAAIPAAVDTTPYGRWRNGVFWLMLLVFNLGLFLLPRR